MQNTKTEQVLIVFFRLTMGWTFLYAASHQVFDPSWSVVGFLSHTKTFHGLFSAFTAPAVAPVITVLVEYGHLLIGLSLVFGLMVRVSASFGTLLMALYWMAHLDFPYVTNKLNFIVDEHVVYAGILIFLIVKSAGHIWGLDGVASRMRIVEDHPQLRPLVS